jgi:Reverse transcriptase (RNA-dependent DNA polymerase)
MINASLHEGYLPATQKHALVSPLLKKPLLDPNELRNYRPVSNMTFVSKVVERIFVKQLVDFL